MKNIIKKFIALVLIFVFGHFFINNVWADEEQEVLPSPTPIHLTIISGENSLYDSEISVTACDSDNNPETEDLITAYCAVIQSGLESDWNWSWAPGAFVNSIEDIVGYTSQDTLGNDVYHYWNWSLNGEMGSTGLNQYELVTSDTILLEFIDPEGEETNNGGGNNGGGSGGGNEIPISFSIDGAIDFLSLNKGDNDFFGGILYSDWVVVGISKSGIISNSLKNELYSFYKDYNYNSSLITDNERHAMALMSLGINPYNETEVNYIEKITDAFDGQQIGDDSLINDDIFGLIVLANAGFSRSDEIIKKISAHIVTEQLINGSWGSIDLTAAAIQALRNFDNLGGVEDAIEKGESYLLEEQNDDGGFNNLFSTSWAIQALSQNNSYEDEVENAISFLANQQKEDGGLDEESLESRIWATAYAIPAVLKMSWSDILESFDKEEVEDNSSNEESGEIIIDDELKEEVVIEEEVKVDEIIKEKVEEREIINNYELIIKNEKKEEDKEVITNYELRITNENFLLASVGSAFLERNEEQGLFFQKLNSFFQRLFSYLKTFRGRLLSV